jgi:type I restriction enzyme R subunit
MEYQSEAELEKQLLKQLKEIGYSEVAIKDEDALIANFRKQLYLHNQKKMESKPFSDKEFERVLLWLEGKSVFQSAKLLRDKMPLERDNGKKLNIEFFDSIKWCKNIFQITSQTMVEGSYKNRYDVTILINGLPLIQIELKRRGLGIDEAINQIERYRKHTHTRLYKYTQIFVVSNGIDTKYFANADKAFNKNYAFFWADKENHRITNLREFASTFLEKCFVSKIVAKFMVINETDKVLMVMRPYQIYAVEAIVDRALGSTNNGYVWHTTGSGKTLTSFKASQIIATNSLNVKKVFFLVDRKDLDRQTLEEFNKFEVGSVDTTDKTDTLVKHLKDINKKLIVTTIQKMSNAVKNKRYEKVMESYKNERVIFIIDECHRTQFGDMHKLIAKHFKRAQYFGFTGTPRFEQNKSQDDRTTADIFGNGDDDRACLHHYLIKDAIHDGNVLGFHVEYVKTIDGDIDEKMVDDEKIQGVDYDEIFNHEDRLNMVSDHIIKNHNSKTRNKKFCSIFATPSIPVLVKYYNLFKSKIHDLKVAAIFTYGANEAYEGRDEHSRDSLEKIIKDYNKMYGTNFSTDNFPAYFADVCKKMKNAEIDVLLVVNMLLTGFDSKLLNTLYVDKNLKYHDLIQAFSRTNRVYDATKPDGSVVCYRNLKKRTDEAVKLFSNTDNVDTVIRKDIGYYLERFREFLAHLRSLAPKPKDVDNIKEETKIKEFVITFRELARTLLHLNSFLDFEFEKVGLGITGQEYQDYKSKYLLLRESQFIKKSSVLAYVDFCAELVHTDKINFEYIMNLIREISLDDKEQQERDICDILNMLSTADNEQLRSKLELLRKFLENVVPTLNKDAVIDSEFDIYVNKARAAEIEKFGKEVGFEEERLAKIIADYEFSGIIDTSKISDNLHVGLLQKAKLTKVIQEFIVNNVDKYN